MRQLLLALLLVVASSPGAAQTDTTGATAAHGAETEAHKVAHPDEPPHEGPAPGHTEKTYFGIPGWVLKLINMFLFAGLLVWLLGGPIKRAFAERRQTIQREAEEARSRRQTAERMTAEIQARLGQIEQEMRMIRERAEAEGERQKRELLAAAEAEAAKIVQSARDEVENRVKSARQELTEYAGKLAADRAEDILRERITESDQRSIFQRSLREVGEA